MTDEGEKKKAGKTLCEIFAEEDAEAARKAVKEGTIRQSLGNPLDKAASDLDVEVALELARQWNDQDVSCPPQRRKDDDQ